MTRFLSPKLLQPGHPLHGQRVDVSVHEGRITALTAAGSGPAEEDDHDLDGHWISPGWWDGQVDFRDPGVERAEGLTHGLRTAAQGGFTRVAPVASTRPCRDQPGEIVALMQRASTAVCGVLPVAALSLERAGQQLTEAHALKDAGARAFSDDTPLERPELLRRALEYHGPVGLPVFSEAHDPTFQPEGVMHEGPMSTALGLPGNSGESELLRIGRDLDILRYAGGRLHFPVITSAAGLRAVIAARKEGLKVTCGTTVHHLCWSDADLEGFNADLKLMPPLRSASDREALVDGVLEGHIDLVVSDHRPRTPEEHDIDFIGVRPGIAGAHAVAPLLTGSLLARGAAEDKVLEALYATLVAGPRQLLGTPDEAGGLMEGGTAEFTVFTLKTPGIPVSSSRAPNTVYGSATASYGCRVVGVVTPRGTFWN